MGVWGAGLYSDDFALDLRSIIKAVTRLPVEPDRLVDILCEAEPASNDPGDPDHATFWLVVADQFARRSIMSYRVRDQAIRIIDTGNNLAGLEELGMEPVDLKKRQRTLKEIRERVMAAPLETKPRPVLKKPQSLLMNVGDAFVYPTSAGCSINPYIAPKNRDKYPWAMVTPDGWSAFVIVDSGRAFDFLSWYRPLVLCSATTENRR